MVREDHSLKHKTVYTMSKEETLGSPLLHDFRKQEPHRILRIKEEMKKKKMLTVKPLF